MTILISKQVAPRVLESVGVDPKWCTSLSMDFDPDGAVTMTVKFIVSTEMARQIGRVMADEDFKHE